MRWAVLLLPIATGCVCPEDPDDVTTPLSKFGGVRVSADLTSFEVRLGNGRLPTIEHGPCPVVSSDLAVRLDNVDLRIVGHGGKRGVDGCGSECTEPHFYRVGPLPMGESVLELSDRSDRFVCQLPDLQAERKAALVPPGPWNLRAGQSVTVQWSPASDLRVLPLRVSLHRDEESYMLLDLPKNSNQGDLVTFMIPAVAPGVYWISFEVVSFDGTAPMLCNPSLPMKVLARSTNFRFVEQITIAR